MSRMLILDNASWNVIQSDAARGRHAEALRGLTLLLGRPGLSATLAGDAHQLAGRLLLDVERYAAARRHLARSAALNPTSAAAYYLWALAHERDPHGCDRRAAVHFRRASRLEPDNQLYRAAYGRAAVRAGAAKAGVRELLRAADNAPGDVAVIHLSVVGLIEAEQFDGARQILTRARFLVPADQSLATLWQRLCFETARCRQRASGSKGTTRYRQDADVARDGGRVVLPFVRLAASTGGAVRRPAAVRLDAVSFPRPHFLRLR